MRTGLKRLGADASGVSVLQVALSQADLVEKSDIDQLTVEASLLEWRAAHRLH